MSRRIAAYVWASPNSLLGLLLGGVMLMLGARAQRIAGALEIRGGLIGSVLLSPRLACPFRAITLGHVILATDDTSLDCSRTHEHVHVQQYERWGPLFLPAYLASSLWQLLRGRDGYKDNHFERQACARCATTAGGRIE